MELAQGLKYKRSSELLDSILMILLPIHEVRKISLIIMYSANSINIKDTI